MKFLVLILFLVGCSESETPAGVQKCGNGACEASETPATCPADCETTASCGDGVCGLGESVNCAQDCASDCGDGVCAPTEDMLTCATDCTSMGTCGDGLCAANETPDNCVEDCGTCNNRCDGNDAHFCGDDGSDQSITCPPDLASSCSKVDDGVLCDCGFLAEGEASCLDGSSPDGDVVECNGGGLEFFVCPVGTACGDSQGVNCYCDNIADGICPGLCNDDIDCDTCTPNCDGKSCGDNGCEGECGTCGQGKTCRESDGACMPICVPNCAGKVCGLDGCGGSCGLCAANETCSTGVCEAPTPTKDKASWTVTLADGTIHNVSFDENTANAFFSCSVNTTTNNLDLEFSNGTDLMRMYIEADPIGFCLFNTSEFTTYTYQSFVSGNLNKTYGISSSGATMSLTLACTADAQRIDGTFSSGRLFENRSSSAFPNSHATISNGTFDCAL